MCGIAGIVQLDGKPVSPESLDRLTDALAHRGPDGRGTSIHGSVGLGHRRLSIIDLTEAGRQPMESSDGNTVLTFNGEIYNFAEERALLESKGRKFRSRSDTEVLLALYEEYGTKCLERLRGMFAFAIHDRRRGKLFLARDRLGKKPILYFRERGIFAFASEMKALRTLPECPREIDGESLHHFLTMMYLPAPLTGIRALKKLPAAHYLLLDVATGKETVERYWEISYRVQHDRSLGEWEEEVLAGLRESVRLRMVSDVPVGAFLSGGIDSAAVVALMSECSAPPVKTFTIGSSDALMNELPEAQIVAERFGTDHHPILLEADIVHLLPELVRTYEQPFADPSCIPTYLVARETRKHVTVALNGDGGDENFGGYIRYPILLFSERWRHLPVHAGMRSVTDMFHRFRNNTFSYRCRRFEHSLPLPWEQRYLQYLSFFTEEEKRALYRPGFSDSFPRTDEFYAALTERARGRAGDVLHKAMSMDMDTYLADDLLPKVDLGSMAHGLEARSPFLDHKLLELTSGIPQKFLLHGRTTKWMLRHLLRRFLPRDFLFRRKRGFRLPLDTWFRHELSGYVSERLLNADPLFREMFDRASVERFLKDYHASHIDYSDHVWALLWLAEWFAQVHTDER